MRTVEKIGRHIAIRLRNMQHIAALPIVLGAFAVNAACPDLPQKLSSSLTLAEGCTYQHGVEIVASNVMLDCRGATLDGQGEARNGVMIRAESGISDISVSNCHIRNFTGSGIVATPNLLQSSTDPAEIEKLYALSPSKLLLNGNEITKIGHDGIYIGAYVTKATVENNAISDNRGTGIYLNFSSKNNIIRNNKITGNGWAPGMPNATWPTVREGMAIDSSAANDISGNIFDHNAAGGLFLYKNCGEFHSKGPALVRWQSSSHNMIDGNIFLNMGIGIWVAQRQSENMQAWDCADPYYDDVYVQDHASNNALTSNTFDKVSKAILIEDNNITVKNNIISNAQNCVTIGTGPRSTALGEPVMGTVVTGNTCDIASGFRFRFGAMPAGFSDNKVGDCAASLDQTPEGLVSRESCP